MLVGNIQNNISFGRSLNSKELRQFCNVYQNAKELIGQTGKSIFIVHDACLPQSETKNTGVANLASDESKEFFKYMKSYLGFNTVEILPNGELHSHNGLYSPYSGSSLSLGNHQINLELLTHDNFNNILLPEEYINVVNSNTAPDKNSIVNHKNVIDADSAHETALRKAFERFKMLDEQTQLKKDFNTFNFKNNDWLEPKAIYNILSKKYNSDDYRFWPGIDGILYEPEISKNDREARIVQILKENPDETQYYKFKQFLAEKHLAIGKKNLNDLGIKLTGDCEINFSKDEIWSHPLAFKKDTFIGEKDWGILSLNFDTIRNPESASAQLLKRKVELCAKRYDGIRFDVGWTYIKPKMFKYNGSIDTVYLGDSVLKYIEQTVKKVKGDNYDLNNLIYEFQGGDIFKYESKNGIKYKTGELLDEVKQRVSVYDTVFMHETPTDIWGSNDAFLKRGWSPDKFVVGTSTHDSQPLRQIANNIRDEIIQGNDKYHKEAAINPLANILKLNPETLENPVEFAKAKWAEPLMAKNNMMFYMDVFGREERFNMHQYNTVMHPEKNFAYKIPSNYKEAYHKAVQEGYGFNIMDGLEKVFKAKGLDKTQTKLYRRIVKFKNILYENGTKEPAEGILKNNKHIKTLIVLTGLICAAGLAIALKILNTKKQNSKNMETDTFIMQPDSNKNNTQKENSLSKINMGDFLDKIKVKSS